jgi:transposase
MTRRYALRDDQWQCIEPLLPGRAGHVGVTARDNRLFVEAGCIATGLAPLAVTCSSVLDDFCVVHPRFSRWSRSGVWKCVFEALAQDADNECTMIDSTIVRAYQHSAGAKKGGHRSKPSGAAGAS